MEYCTVYHRDESRCGQEISETAQDNLDNEPRRAGIKRKCCDSEVSVEAKRNATAQNNKKPFLGAEISAHKDPLLSLMKELEWMREQEDKCYMRLYPWPAGDLVCAGGDVTKQKRTDVVDWLLVIHQHLRLERNTLHVAVNLLDRYIQKGRISVKALKPIALSCLWIASKFCDLYDHIPSESLLVRLLGSGHTLEEFHTCERMVLRAVGCHLWRPTALQFTKKYIRVLHPALRQSIKAKLQSALELCLRDINMSYKNPSEVGLAALSYALGLETDRVADKLQQLSGYDVHCQHPLVIHICNAAFDTMEAEDADPIFTKYPHAFVASDNAYLKLRMLANKK